MSYNIYVTKVKNIRPAENADRLNLCEVFGNTTVVDKTVNETDLYLYLPTDGRISVEFGESNNLFRKKDDAGNNIGGFIDAEKRNISAIRLRGNKSDGLVLPLSSLSSFGDITSLKEGDIVTVFNGHVIAEKYIPRTNHRSSNVGGNKTRKKKVNIAPLFAEHADTEQLAYNLSAFKPGDEIEITLKMHGTSQRTGYLPVLKGYKRTLWDKITRKQGKPIYKYDYISGTRRTVLENFDGGFYGSNEFRQQHHDKFVGKLNKGETVYYEVVGYTHTGAPIMGNGKNEKLGKDFVKQYGKETVFSYGCNPNGFGDGLSQYATMKDGTRIAEFNPEPQSDIYVYRMTMTNEDGFVVEYSPDFMRYRCEQMGVKYVPVFAKAILPNEKYFDKEYPVGNYVKEMAEQFYDGVDPVGRTHIREGVVIRIVNRPKFTAFKHKNFNFKVLEGLIKDTASAPDMEEAQEL
jgi:hypothetical protein